jgi:hypothetical protein
MFYQVEGMPQPTLNFMSLTVKHFVIGSVYFIQNPITILLCQQQVISKWHAAIDGNLKMEVTGFSL